MNEKKLLLVEDDESTIYTVERCLEELPFTLKLDICRSGESAVEGCKETAYSLILMDIRLGGMNGIETTRIIRQLPFGKTCPIIAFTANSREYPKEVCCGVGMSDLIDKPFDVDEFLEIVTSYLGEAP